MKYADADFPLLASGWRYSGNSSTSNTCCVVFTDFAADFFMFLPLVPATKVVDFAYYSYFGLTWICSCDSVKQYKKVIVSLLKSNFIIYRFCLFFLLFD